MKQRRLFWQIFPVYFFAVVATVMLLAVYVFHTVHTFCRNQIESELKARVLMVVGNVVNPEGFIKAGEVDAVCKDLGSRTATRITVILASGKVLGDTDNDPSLMNDHSRRPEILEALSVGTGIAIRYSETVRRDMIYVATAVKVNGETAGVVRVAVPLTAVDEALAVVNHRIGVLAVVLMLAATGIVYVVSRRISRPIEDLTEGVERFGRGDLKFRLPAGDNRELNDLATAMNRMATQLDERIQAVERQRNEKEAVFGSMVEGVLAIDNDEKIIYANSSAMQMLDLDLEKVMGRSILEVVRNSNLQALAARALEGPGVVEADITLYGDADRFIQVHGAGIKDKDGRRVGAVIVWNDVTRIRKLEGSRRDFVSNVSHELRTPITAIKGFVETLLDGSADKPEELRRFLDIIAKQTERLNTLISDILSLSKIENDTEKNVIDRKPCRLIGVLKEAIEVCSLRAAKKNAEITLECDSELMASINAALFEQALVNLVDNAVKYSDEGCRVDVTAQAVDSSVVVRVVDRGCGIERKHLARVFERFYRVDEGRSRQMGGTGLGLAIVKHIALAHSGEVEVDSTPGKGSVFSIKIPRG